MSEYIFTHEGKQYTPSGIVNVVDPDAHNKELDRLTVESAIQTGRAIFYLSGCNVRHTNYSGIGSCYSGDCGKVSTWAGGWSVDAHYARKSWHNMAGRDGRTDVWFTGPDGKLWHGVNIGNNQILRSRRLKSQRS